MSVFEFYINEGFKLFQCSFNKAPSIPKGTDWRDSENHLTAEQADRIAVSGGLIGAWIPKNMIVVDVDCHAGKDNGLEYLDQLKKDLNINYSLAQETLVVKTGGGGYHLYYYTDKEKAPAMLTSGVDIKTHSGYVIAAGSPGYKALNDNDPADLPFELSEYIDQKLTERKTRQVKHSPNEPLPLKALKSALNKLPVENFRNNEKWLEFVMAAIATCGNDSDVIDALEEWSKLDSEYENDSTIRPRLESIDPTGGVTAATFIFILRREGCSDYLINKVQAVIGGKIDPVDYIENKEKLNRSGISIDKKISESKSTSAFFYMLTNRDGADVLKECLKDSVIYVAGEKKYFVFNGSRWEELTDILRVTSAVLEEAVNYFYTDHGAEDNDGEENLTKCIKKLGETKFRKDIIADFCQHKEIHRTSVNWDSPSNRETLTLKDGVLDFSGREMIIRAGQQDEYRKSYMNYSVSDFKDNKFPGAFADFMSSTFPDRDTQKTAMYALSLFVSGVSTYRTFQVWHGGGRNGKSTLMEIMKHVLGSDAAITYDTKLLLSSKNDTNLGLTPELATFQGARVAFGSETEERKRISTGLVKQLAGGDTIKANPKHRDPVEFEATWQLVLSTNDLPFFSSSDQAFIDRLLLLPFKVKFARTEEEFEKYQKESEYVSYGKDGEKLKAEVEAEAADIIKLLISRYIELRDSLNGTIPLSEWCEEKKKIYISDNDDIDPFIDNLCVVEEDAFVTSSDITEAFREFIGNSRVSVHHVVSAVMKAKRSVMKDVQRVDVYDHKLGYETKKQARGLTGIRMKNNTELMQEDEA